MVRRRSAQAKVFRDNTVPGDYVKLSATAVAISDTPIFQRLRYLKQLGMAGAPPAAASRCRLSRALPVQLPPPGWLVRPTAAPLRVPVALQSLCFPGPHTHASFTRSGWHTAPRWGRLAGAVLAPCCSCVLPAA